MFFFKLNCLKHFQIICYFLIIQICIVLCIVENGISLEYISREHRQTATAILISVAVVRIPIPRSPYGQSVVSTHLQAGAQEKLNLFKDKDLLWLTYASRQSKICSDFSGCQKHEQLLNQLHKVTLHCSIKSTYL